MRHSSHSPQCLHLLPSAVHCAIACHGVGSEHVSAPLCRLLGKSKKSVGNKLRHRWLRMDADGDTCEVTMSKAAIHNRYGVQVPYLRNGMIKNRPRCG